jgi:GGDEF domain-containing protein
VAGERKRRIIGWGCPLARRKLYSLIVETEIRQGSGRVARNERSAARAIQAPPAPDAPLLAEIERLKGELLRAERKIAELEARADVDPLLDILNRRGFERELRRSLGYVGRYGVEAALIYLDLDGFKAVKDHHGHAAGDRLLKLAAGELVRHVRSSDVVARLGGDEFAVLLWNLSAEQAEAKARAGSRGRRRRYRCGAIARLRRRQRRQRAAARGPDPGAADRSG